MVIKSGVSSSFLCKHLYHNVAMCLTECTFTLHNLHNYSHTIAAVVDCFSALKSSRKNLPIVFSINRNISLLCDPST